MIILREQRSLCPLRLIEDVLHPRGRPAAAETGTQSDRQSIYILSPGNNHTPVGFEGNPHKAIIHRSKWADLRKNDKKWRNKSSRQSQGLPGLLGGDKRDCQLNHRHSGRPDVSDSKAGFQGEESDRQDANLETAS